MRNGERDPFAPVENVAGVLFAVAAILILGIGLILAVGAGGREPSVTIAGIGGGPEACVTTGLGEVPQTSGWDPRPADGEQILGLRRAAASSTASELEVCLTDATVPQRVAAALAPVGGLFVLLGATWLVLRAARAGRRHGLFTPELATRIRQLGWFLLVVALIYPFVAAAGEGVVLAAAIREYSPLTALWHPDFSAGMVFVALGALSFARILRRAVPLQEEMDTTV